MELLSIAQGKSSWFFDLYDLNPKGKKIFPEIFFKLRDRYAFSKFPNSVTDVDESKGYVFQGGSFVDTDETVVNIDLSIYNDGLVASSQSSTRNTDAFLHDALTWLSAEWELNYRPDMIRRKVYISDVVVHFDYPLTNVNPKLSEFASQISKLVNVESNEPPFYFTGLNFWPDSYFATLKQVPFTIDPRINSPFSERRHFSRAPLPTDKHLTMLQGFETIILAG